MLKMPSRLRDLLPFHDRAITRMIAITSPPNVQPTLLPDFSSTTQCSDD